MKYLLLTLTCFVLLSCSKKQEPIIAFTVTQNAVGEIVMHADIAGISKKQINVCGFSCGLTENHAITSSQIRSNKPNSNSITKTMSTYDLGNYNFVSFSPNTTYYFTCFVGTSDGKLYRTTAKAFTTGMVLPCTMNPNTYSVADSWNNSILDSGTSSTANFSGTSGGGVYKIYSVNFGPYTFKFTFKGVPTTQAYSATSSSNAFSTNEVFIQNSNTGANIYNGNVLYVKNNNDGTFTMAMCSGSSYDSGYSSSSVEHSFKVNGFY